MHSINEWWLWVGFFTFIAAMLAVDIFLLGGKKAHRVSTRESLSWFIVWVSLSLMFNLLLWKYLLHTTESIVAQQKSLEFFTGYLIELSLSVDNMFIFIMIFNYFAVPAKYQKRVLIYGVIGAIVMRLIMISFGVILVKQFHWILYVFGIILIITGIKLLIFANEKPNLELNPILRFLKKHLRVTENIDSEKFILRKKGLLYATPLLLVLILIETSDLIFAMDSIPAIFAITEDPFIIYSSNIFAILGLRSLYFLLVNIADRFHFLKYGIALILLFIGSKMLIAYWFKIPIFIALGLIITILLLSMLLSIIAPQKTN